MSRREVHVISNGKQTEEFAEARLGFSLSASNFGGIQYHWENEGPEADYTARITAAYDGSINFSNSIVLFGRISRNPLNFSRSIYEIFDSELIPGYAFFITTYNGEGGTEPSLSVPLPIAIPGSLEDNMEMLWNTFNKNNRVALAGKEIDRGSNRFRYAPFKNARLGD